MAGASPSVWDVLAASAYAHRLNEDNWRDLSWAHAANLSLEEALVLCDDKKPVAVMVRRDLQEAAQLHLQGRGPATAKEGAAKVRDVPSYAGRIDVRLTRGAAVRAAARGRGVRSVRCFVPLTGAVPRAHTL